MEQVQLGKSGLHISQVCLGTMTFGREADEKTSFAIMDAFVERGGTMLDTANVYQRGTAERVVGKWLSERRCRDSIVLATKVFGSMGDTPNEGGLSRVHIVREVEASLRRLRTDVIDLYQIHRWYPKAPVEETSRALDDLIRQGKVRYIGSSNLRAFQLLIYLTTAEALGFDRFISHQPVYNALNRAIELELLPLCEREGVGVICFNPLAGGVLTGKYLTAGPPPKGSRMEAFPQYHQRFMTDESTEITARFVAAAAERGMSPAQLAIAWIIAEPRITAPIVGARSVEQLVDTLGALDRPLSAEERASLPAIGAGRWVGLDPVYDRDRYKRPEKN